MMTDDNSAYRFPVSVKAVLIHDGKVLLLKNERDEWELPGGKLELDESPVECVVREVLEETTLAAFEPRPLNSFVYWVAERIPVLIVPFHCRIRSFSNAKVSHEHKQLGIFDLSALEHINLPDGYRRTIFESLQLIGDGA